MHLPRFSTTVRKGRFLIRNPLLYPLSYGRSICNVSTRETLQTVLAIGDTALRAVALHASRLDANPKRTAFLPGGQAEQGLLSERKMRSF